MLRAMRDHPNGRGAFSDWQEPGTIKGGDYWCVDAGTLTDFMNSAQKNADVTRKMQLIHRHSSFEECDGFEHIEVVHDEARSAAVGGLRHG